MNHNALSVVGLHFLSLGMIIFASRNQKAYDHRSTLSVNKYVRFHSTLADRCTQKSRPQRTTKDLWTEFLRLMAYECTRKNAVSVGLARDKGNTTDLVRNLAQKAAATSFDLEFTVPS